MISDSSKTIPCLVPGMLRRIHHIALNVKDMNASRYFYGVVLGLKELKGEEVPETLKELVASGKVANFITPDGTIVDLFWKPELSPANSDPNVEYTRAAHLAFDIAPSMFDRALYILNFHEIEIASGPVTRPTGKGIYFYDPDGFLVEIRCDPA
ncbi:MAG: VOC family protein [Prochloraceae cyanobacterium]